MFDHRHYVPILKTRAGEFWALRHLTDDCRSFVTPLLELDKIPQPRTTRKEDGAPKKKRAPRKPATLKTHLEKKCAKIAAAWGEDEPLFLDPRWLAGQAGDPTITNAVFAAARKADLAAIPVVHLLNSEETLLEIAEVAKSDGRGAMLRISPDDLSTPHLIKAVIKQLSLRPKAIHLMVDYATRPMDISSHVPRIPVVDSWKTLSFASGVFPASVSSLPHQRWHRIERGDAKSWRGGIARRSLERLPSYSDYTMRAPGKPAGGGNPPVVLRYTTEDNWLVRVDGSLHGGDSPEMLTICTSLIARPEYCGEDYSAGDKAFSEIADGSISTGGPTQWVQYAMNHHIEFVVDSDIP